MATAALSVGTTIRSPRAGGPRVAPGLVLCGLVAALAYALAAVEHLLFGAAWLEPLVLAILLGAGIRTAVPLGASLAPGIRVGAKTVLEVAVVLLGASVSAAMIGGAGPALLAGIAGVVAVTIGASFLIGRALGLAPRMALLVACGNSICGNSAIAAVAPVIGADGEDVAASIAFTAVLGVVVVLGLPLLGAALGMSGLGYGTLAGLTVYAVPQVIAAAAPLGATAVQMGTLVKLVRVLMLGPVCLAVSLVGPRLLGRDRSGAAPQRPPLTRLVPWFIIGFLLLVAARSLGLIPPAGVALAGSVATPLTVVSMAALGLGVDVRTVARAGTRVSLAVVLSLLFLGAISFALIAALHLA